MMLELDLPCTEEATTCLETCGKLLECKRHYCIERCHTGPCGTVSIMRDCLLFVYGAIFIHCLLLGTIWAEFVSVLSGLHLFFLKDDCCCSVFYISVVKWYARSVDVANESARFSVIKIFNVMSNAAISVTVVCTSVNAR